MISVIIPTYKNKDLLIENLNHNLLYLNDCEVVVVNDDPDNSLRLDMEKFPQVKLVENKTNMGFAPSMNVGIANSTGEYLFFLNNDVVLSDPSYLSAVEYLKNNDKAFAVTFAQLEKDNTIVGKNKIYWEKGFFQHMKAQTTDSGPTAWAECGSCLVDRKKFMEIGGFDEIYAPFYWEDVDLSYRAYKKGYEVRYDPLILVKHEHETTTSKFFSPDQVKTIAQRNQFIFIWKNINDGALFVSHLFAMFKLILMSVVKGDTNTLTAFGMAFALIGEIMKKRKAQNSTKTVEDKKIIDMFNKV